MGYRGRIERAKVALFCVATRSGAMGYRGRIESAKVALLCGHMKWSHGVQR